MFPKLYIFLWKDWVQARSYKASFIFQNVAILFPLVTLLFLDRVFENVSPSAIQPYGGDYVAFALIGVVVTTYSATALRAFSMGLRTAQMTGNLEALLMTRASIPTVLFGWSLYPFLRATISSMVFLAAGFLLLDLELARANIPGATLIFILTVLVTASLGIIAASFVLVFKQGDPFTGIIVVAAGLLSGTMYPITVLPDWLQVISKALPQTHSIEGMRQAVLQGASMGELRTELAVLTVFAALLFPLALTVFRHAMHRAKVEGSLAHY